MLHKVGYLYTVNGKDDDPEKSCFKMKKIMGIVSSSLKRGVGKDNF